MMDFFRKHQKSILLLMALLMVMFLVPQACQTGPGRRGGGPVYGQFNLDGKNVNVTYGEIVDAFRQMQLLVRMRNESVSRLVASYVNGRPDSEESGGLAWHLWGRLVDHYNVAATEQERKDFFRKYQVTSEQINEVAKQTTVANVYAAFDQLVAMEKMYNLVMTQANVVPESEVRQWVRDITEKAYVNQVQPNVKAFTRLVDQPSEQRLGELFLQYQNIDRRAGSLEPGYRVSDTVSLEILAVDAMKTISDAEVQAYYQSHQKEFEQLVPATQPATQPGATQPAVPAMVTQVKPLNDALRMEIRRKLLDAPSGEKGPGGVVLSRGELIVNLLADAAQKLAAGQIGTYERAKELLVQKVGPEVQLLTPKDLGLTQWLEMRQDSPDDPLVVLLNRSHPQASEDGPAVWQVAFTAEPFPENSKGVPNPIKVNEQRAEVFQIENRPEYLIWRLTAATPSHTPTNLAEVRSQVVADARRLAAYDIAREQLEQVAKLVKSGQPIRDALAMVNAELNKRPAATQPETQPATQAATQPAEFFDPVYNKEIVRASFSEYGLRENPSAPEAVTKAVFRMAGKVGGATTQPSRELVEVVTAASYEPPVLIQFENLKPATELDLLLWRSQVARMLQAIRQQNFEYGWKNIRAHVEFRQLASRE